ncbi:MAG TPA: C45 family autoproteolytic acyltransferase/hydrolase [Candidatus Polarisedimenticolaceae bacterium]|nr:C45 family autoproteolytic acyltransferase/hydrolase [Candidatus Polarisedimenticolaceae bacterium]
MRRLSVLLSLLLLTGCVSAAQTSVVQEDRVIAGSPKDSLEVRHLVLRGTNEQIGRALAEIGKERYGVRLEPARDPGQVRAQRKFLERNYPILLDRMRGVAAAFGKSVDDDAWDFAGLGFTDLKAGCSIVHAPPSMTTNGKSIVSRDYDFTTGSLGFGFLPPGMLHPTARPYLLELHPDKGYASIAMVAYDLLSGVLDGINSEGLTVTLAMDNQIFSDGTTEPTRAPAVGLGELQTLRLLLDTCATVEEAKQALMGTKQYYQYVPIHYLIADRHGDSFVWEYSESHNKEYVIENPGKLLVMTNFTIHSQMEDGKPPSAEKARATCKRYAYLNEKLAQGGLDDETIRNFHRACDAQASQAVNPNEPPERTFWHAFYYPEERRVRLSYYLRDEPLPGNDRFVKPVRSDYVEFRLEPTGGANAKAAAPAKPEAKALTASTPAAPSEFEAAGGTIKREGARIVSASFAKATNLDAVLPLLPQLRDVEELSLSNPGVTDAHVCALQGLPKLRSLGLMGAPIGDDALAVMKTLPALRELNVIGTKITDAGLAHLSGLTFEYLGLKGTAVTDAGVARLTSLKELEALNIADTQMTDAGLAHLGRIPSLKGLNVSGTKITDAGLIQLKPIPKLTKLNVSGTAVTEQGVKDAKKFLPFFATITR